jgi:hypothetical protein
MSDEIFDKKADFFKRYFEKALSFNDYIKSGTPNQFERWQSASGKISLNSTQKTTLSGFKRKMNLLVLSGIWCGDCVRQCPMLDIISKDSELIDYRLIDNQAYPELRDEMRICGGSRVPVAIILSEDFFEVARFGDRTLSVYRKKALNEVGAACDPGLLPPPSSELSAELGEWLDFIERAQLMLRLSHFLRSRHKD